ncbi:hypothetical protein AB9K41_21795 [Cribrihabitans sp. XS_ASV171]
MADDALTDVQKLAVVAEADIRLLDLAADLDIDEIGPVDHDVGDIVACQQRLQGAIAQNVVADLLGKFGLFRARQHGALGDENLVHHATDFPPGG